MTWNLAADLICRYTKARIVSLNYRHITVEIVARIFTQNTFRMALSAH